MTRLLCVAPELPVEQLESALDWYRAKLGFVMRLRMEDYAIVARNGVDLHLFEAAAGDGPISLHIFATDLTELAADMQSRGVEFAQGLTDQPWGTRDFRIKDSFGNLLKFTEAH